MTERVSIQPLQGLRGWLRDLKQSTRQIQLGGQFQPSLAWSARGTGWLWVESLQGGQLVMDTMLTADLAQLLSLEAAHAGDGVFGVRCSTDTFLTALTEVLDADCMLLASEPLRRLIKMAQLALRIVETKDVVAFASPQDTPWAEILDTFYQLSSPDAQEWLPWSAHPTEFSSAWIPAWKDPTVRALRNVYVGLGRDAEHPGADRARPRRNDVDPMLLVDVWLSTAVDWWTRQVLGPLVPMNEETPSKSSYHVPYRGEQDMMTVWAEALWASHLETTFAADAWLVWRTIRQALLDSGWRREWLQDQTGKNDYHLDLELIPPASSASGSGDWTLVYYIAHNHWPAAAPLREWWLSPERVWRIGHDTLVNPDTWILPFLYQVGEVCPWVLEGLAKPGPFQCWVPSDRVFEFVTTMLPQLRALGCTCRIPELAEEAMQNIRIRVQIRKPVAKGRANAVAPPASSGLFGAEQLVSFDWTVVVGDETISKSDFEIMVEQNTPLVQLGGSWRLLPVEAILEQVRLLGSSNRSNVINLLQLSRGVLMSEAASEELGIQVEVDYEDDDDLAEHSIEHALRVLSQAHQVEPLPIPKGFQGTLRRYQQVGYAWLLHLRSIGCGGCLADDMGLGKTIQVIAYLLKLMETDDVRGPHLLLCPTSLLQNWRAELARFAPEIRVYIHHGALRNEGSDASDSSLALAARSHDVVLTTYGTVVRDIDVFSELNWDVVIADEAQNIKNHETKQAQAVRGLPSFHRVALTGTPVENRLEELWSIFQFVSPGYLGSLAWFRKTFAQPISSQPESRAARQLHRLLRPVLLRRRKTEPEIQLELPEKWEVNEYAGLSSEQAVLYQSVLNRLFGQMEEARSLDQASAMARRGQILSALVRLKQVCDHPCLIVGGSGDVRRSGKLKLLMDVLQDVVDDGESALVFTQFRDMGELLCDVMEIQFGHRPRFLHGGLSAAARGELVEAYQSGRDPSPILVLSLKTGGVGLNLTRANHVFHYDRWWNPAVEDQATDRAFRIGQTKDVQVHKLICSGTLEERIDALIHAKRAVSAAVVGESEGWVTELDDDALRQLFALDADVGLEVDDAE